MPSCAVRTSFPEELEHHGHRAGRVPVVVHHQDAPPRAGRASAPPRPAHGGRASGRTLEHGQPDGERAALVPPGALGRDRAAVHLDQPLDQRQPDAEAAGGPLDAPVHLGEHVEDAAQRLGRDADPVVADGDDDLLAAPLGGEPDVPAARGVLGAVGEQVAEDLGQPGQVGVEADRLGRQRDGEFVPRGLDQRAGRSPRRC